MVLIVADDLGYGDLGFTGSTQIKTPHIDKLAASGVTFTQGYVSSAVCSPSRAGFITGINQVEFGHDNNLGGVEPGFDPEYNGLPLTQQTIADHLNKLGYVNGLIGKWHLGKESQFHPLKRGFDEFWGYTGGGHDYFEALPNGKGYKEPLESNFKTPDSITYITDDVGNESVDFINRHKDEPFFLFSAFNAPHTPMQALEEDLALYQNSRQKATHLCCNDTPTGFECGENHEITRRPRPQKKTHWWYSSMIMVVPQIVILLSMRLIGDRKGFCWKAESTSLS